MYTLFFRYLVITFLGLCLLSLFALWSWGRFARTARGPASTALPVTESDTILDRYIHPLLKIQGSGHSAAALIDDPMQAFLARAHSARTAQRSLDIQYYIWKQDLTGHLLEYELIRAADRGVRVRLLLDDMNAVGKDQALLALAEHPLVDIRLFNPARNRAKGVRRALEMGFRFIGFNRRMHNKAWIADNRLAVVGGRNVGDEYFGAADTNFRDTDLVLLGPAVQQSSDIFDMFWNSAAVVPLQVLHPKGSGWSIHEFSAQQEQWLTEAQDTPWLNALHQHPHWVEQFFTGQGPKLHWSPQIKVLSDPPEKASPVASKQERSDWLLYDVMALLFSAQKQNWIISPYFVPGESGSLLLTGQARRQLDVRVLTNSLAATDVPMVHAGYIRYRHQLLQQGVRLLELKPGNMDPQRRLAGISGASLHSKVLVVDGQRGFVGSFNFDPRSAQVNTEMGVLFEHPQLAAELQEFFLISTEPDLAWNISLTPDKQLRWHGQEETPTLHQEPQTSWGLRLLVKILGILPIESQL